MRHTPQHFRTKLDIHVFRGRPESSSRKQPLDTPGCRGAVTRTPSSRYSTLFSASIMSMRLRVRLVMRFTTSANTSGSTAAIT